MNEESKFVYYELVAKAGGGVYFRSLKGLCRAFTTFISGINIVTRRIEALGC